MIQNRDLVKDLGFVEIPHPTIGNSLVLFLTRNRVISFGCIGTPNEMLWIGKLDENKKSYSDLVNLHNWDYDGFLSIDKLKTIISLFKEQIDYGS